MSDEPEMASDSAEPLEPMGDEPLTYAEPSPGPLMAIRDATGAEIVRIERDGTARYPENSSLDDLSREFWQAVAGQQGVLREIREKLTVYISGPMDGIPNSNIPTFRSAAAILRQGGYQVVDVTQLEGFGRYDTAEAATRLRLAALLQCNAIALLAGWHDSATAQLEASVAAACGMTVAPVDYWLVEPSG